MVRERAVVESAPRGELTNQELEQLDAAIESYKTSGPSIEDFPDRPEVAREDDQKEVERLRKEFARRTTRDSTGNERMGAALEMVVNEFGTSWLPGTISKTSEYDDYRNGTDLVLEMEDDYDRKLRVALDVTASVEKARTKVADIMKNLYEGTLTRLKYFKSELDESMDEKDVPRVVIGTNDHQAMVELLRLYLSYQNTHDKLRRNVIRQSITEHPLGREFAGQLLLQLTQSIKALSKSPSNADRERKIAVLQATIDALQGARKKNTALARPSSGAQGRNGVFDVITKFWVTA
jgi:hypothetical protein